MPYLTDMAGQLPYRPPMMTTLSSHRLMTLARVELVTVGVGNIPMPVGVQSASVTRGVRNYDGSWTEYGSLVGASRRDWYEVVRPRTRRSLPMTSGSVEAFGRPRPGGPRSAGRDTTAGPAAPAE